VKSLLASTFLVAEQSTIFIQQSAVFDAISVRAPHVDAIRLWVQIRNPQLSRTLT
jgi:hypothetical protein